MNRNVLSGLRIPKANEVRMEPLSDEEINRLISCFNLDWEIGCRNAAIIWLFLDTRLRCAELVSSLAIYELVWRTSVTRFLFGIKLQKRSTPAKLPTPKVA
jgi:site-specific recombinase XerC